MMSSFQFRVSLLESFIIFALLSVGYQGAILSGRKLSSFFIGRPSRQNANIDSTRSVFDPPLFEEPLLADRMDRKERLLQQFNSTCSLEDDQHVILAEALLHPALLAHPNPRHIVILTNSTMENRSHSYMDQVLRHKSVEKVRILQVQIEDLQETWASNVTHQNQLPWIHSRLPSWNGTNRNSFSRTLEDVGNTASENPVNILFVDSTVQLSPTELTFHIHSQKNFRNSEDFTVVVELMSRSVIPDWVDALSNWESVEDVTIRLPLPPPRRNQLQHYLLAFHDSRSQAFWHRNEAEWNRHLLDKLHEPREESFVLDSTLMFNFEYPSKHSEVEFCREHSSHKLCQSGGSGFDPSKPNVPVDLLDVQRSQQGEHAGRGVFTTVDIAAKSYIGIDTALVRLPWSSTHLMLKFTAADQDIYSWAHNDLEAYFDGYGIVREPWGMIQYDVDATKLTFVNHGCNGSNNVGPISLYHEMNLQLPTYNMNNMEDANSLWIKIPQEYLAATLDDELYLPIRNPGNVISTESNQFITAGQEILDNYLTFAGTDGVQFWNNIESLQQECSGVAGFIEAWETRYREDKNQVPDQQNLTEPLTPSCQRQDYVCLSE